MGSSQTADEFVATPLPTSDRFMQSEVAVIDINGSAHHATTYTRDGETVKTHIAFQEHLDLSLPSAPSNAVFKKTAFDIVTDLQSELQIDRPLEELALVKSEKSLRYTHLSFNQSYQGIPIYGGQLKMHFDKDMKLAHVNGSTIQTPSAIGLSPSISSTSAIETCLQNLELQFSEDETTGIVGYHAPKAELVIYNHFGMSMLCWKVNVFADMAHDWEMLISATSGEELLRFNEICHAIPEEVKLDLDFKDFDDHGYHSIQTLNYKGNYVLYDGSLPGFDASNDQSLVRDGGVMIWNLGKTNADLRGEINQFRINGTNDNSSETWMSQWGNKSVFKAAATCQNHVRKIFDYYKGLGYLGLNGQNSVPIRIYMNAGTSNNPDIKRGLDNAFWNNELRILVFGSGETHFKQTAASLDLVAHEYTHGVVGHTCKLLGTGESRAINEAIADIMALVIAEKASNSNETKKNNWRFGSDALNGGAESDVYRGAIRNVANPHNGFLNNEPGFHYKHVNDIKPKSELSDPSWEPYYLSTLISHAFYNLIRNSKTNSGIVIDKDADHWSEVFFNAARYYLTPDATFEDFILAVKNSAIERYQLNNDGSKHEWEFAMDAFASVGFDVPESMPLGVVLPSVEGESYILTKRTSETNPGISAYSLDYRENQRLLESIALPKSEISTTDNGKKGFYVDHQGRLRKLDMAIAHEKREETITIDSVFGVVGQSDGWKWRAVSISPNGDKLALTRQSQDSSVYIYNINLQKLYRYRLQPFYYFDDKNGSDVYPVTVENISWSFDGTEILFDCVSSIGSERDEVNYHRNVAKIKVWDALTNSAVVGHIDAPLGGRQLPHIHYMNPRFAKNRPSVIVFDQFDDKSGRNTIWIYDLAQKNVVAPQKLFETAIEGHPCFTHNDNKIAYTTTDAKGDTVIMAMDVNLDELNMLDTRHDLIGSKRKLPVWLTVGERPTTEESETLGMSPISENGQIALFPNPAHDYFSILTEGHSMNSVEVFDVQGQLVLTQPLTLSASEYRVDIAHLPSGVYTCIITTSNGVLKKRLVKE